MYLYIDPGTGSMLFTILIGVLGALVYFFRNALMPAAKRRRRTVRKFRS